MLDELTTLDATAQAELVRRGEATPLELVDAAIARIERVNGQLNAVITPLFERARARAAGPLPDGPFRGVPFLFKDLGARAAGDPYHAGLRAARQAGWVAPHSTVLARRFLDAGLVVLGKTNTPELGLVPTTEPVSYGPTRNPWDPARSPGGSSGGSAAAVASGMVPAAHAGDGGGSIRIPASMCGLVGLKPSRGRVPLWPDLAEGWAGLVSEFAVTRSVRDMARLLDVAAGPCPGDLHTPPLPARPYAEEVGADPGRLRVGWLTQAPDTVTPTHPECAAAVASACRLLESLGHHVEEGYPPALLNGERPSWFLPVLAAWTAGDVELWSRALGRPLGPDDLEPATWTLVELGRGVTALAYLEGLHRLQQWSAAVQAWWAEGWDLLVTPTVPEPPPPLGAYAPPPDDPWHPIRRSAVEVAYTMPFNVTGQPAVSLPLAWTAGGLPVGVQLVAAYGREDLLVRVAAQLEAAQGWAGRRPAVTA